MENSLQKLILASSNAGAQETSPAQGAQASSGVPLNTQIKTYKGASISFDVLRGLSQLELGANVTSRVPIQELFENSPTENAGPLTATQGAQASSGVPLSTQVKAYTGPSISFDVLRRLSQQDLGANLTSNLPIKDPFKNSPTANIEPHIKVLQQGDPKVGTVIFIKQIHWIAACDSDEVLRKSAGWYQDAILHYLIKEKATAIFEEGLSEEDEGKVYDHLPLEDLRELPNRFYDSGRIDRPDHHWYDLVASAGAGTVYSIFRKEQTLHATTSRDVEALGDIIDMQPLEYVRDFYVHDFREKVTSLKVMEFLKDNPGETVHMIYGANHVGLHDDFGRAQVIEVSWPELLQRSSLEEEGAITSAKDPQSQLALVKESWLLSNFTWDKLLNEEVQLSALPKLRSVAKYFDFQAQELKDYLIREAKGPKVIEAVEKEFERFNSALSGGKTDYSGVFEAFTPKRISYAIVNSPVEEQAKQLQKAPYFDPSLICLLTKDELSAKALDVAASHPLTRAAAHDWISARFKDALWSVPPR